MFPFTHMTATELAQAARDSGPLGGVLADRIDALAGEVEDLQKEVTEADEKRDEAETELSAANRKADDLGDALSNAADELDEILSTIPEKTTHKGLIVIRERLELLKTTITGAAK